ncbi:MAG: hypothetical protein IIU14_02460 [Ruminococcus sp.]|nr:hypothetical protein [Ruminococcus sp.]
MKKCDYCGKEITYFEQYCCDECQRKTLDFYDYQAKYSKFFGIVNAVCVMGIPIGLFMFSLVRPIGFTMMSFAVLFLGLMIVIFPFPVENMISSMKLKKAVDVTRIIGAVLLALGILLVILDFIFFIRF